METLNKIKDKLKIRPSLLIAIMVLIIIGIIIFKMLSNTEQQPPTYDYNRIEQQIADEVIEYLSLYLDLPDAVAAQIADAAVQNYRVIMTSDVDIVNSDHTEAIRQRIRSSMIELIDDAGILTDDNLDGFSSGIAEIIWNAILSQIKEVSTTDYEEEYIYLAESIQSQIEELEERKMKISIQANIQNNTAADIDAESLLATVNGMTDEELQELAESLGLSLEDLLAMINAYGNRLDEDLNKGIEEKLETIKKELAADMEKKYEKIKDGEDGSDGKNGRDGQTGRDGKNGRDGENGIDGKDGQDGKDGENGLDGKTTFIAYADDIQGTGFSLTPTETSKYVGTCITSDDSQPEDYASYSNWQIYRTYIITTSTDENNVTTVHIN